MRPAIAPKRSTTTSRINCNCICSKMFRYSTVKLVATLALPPALVVLDEPKGARSRVLRADDEMLSCADKIDTYSASNSMVVGARDVRSSPMIERRSSPR